MKVLYLNPGNLFGGIETLLVTLSRHRGECPGMIPEFGVCFEGRYSAALREAGSPVYDLGQVRMSRPWQGWLARRRLRAVLRARRPDVVICHGSWTLALLGPAVRAAGLPLVYWSHDPVGGNSSIYDRSVRRTLPDFIIVNSRYTAARQYPFHERIPRQVIYCALTPPRRHFNESERAAFRAAQDTPEDTAVILQVSRLDPHKGHRLHLEALARIADLPWVCWMVVGAQKAADKEYVDSLKTLAAGLGIAAKMRWLGWQEDVEIVYESADIFCQPNSGPEPFGLTFVEALWRGKPVVTAALAGGLEVLNEECGILTEPGSAASVAAALASLIGDRELRERLGAAGPARAEFLCGPKARLEELEACLAGVMGKR